MCCSPWGCKESDTTERLNWTEATTLPIWPHHRDSVCWAVSTLPSTYPHWPPLYLQLWRQWLLYFVYRATFFLLHIHSNKYWIHCHKHSLISRLRILVRDIISTGKSTILVEASLWFSSVQSLSRVWLFATPWIAARQASLSITNSQS